MSSRFSTASRRRVAVRQQDVGSMSASPRCTASTRGTRTVPLLSSGLRATRGYARPRAPRRNEIDLRVRRAYVLAGQEGAEFVNWMHEMDARVSDVATLRADIAELRHEMQV